MPRPVLVVRLLATCGGVQAVISLSDVPSSNPNQQLHHIRSPLFNLSQRLTETLDCVQPAFCLDCYVLELRVFSVGGSRSEACIQLREVSPLASYWSVIVTSIARPESLISTFHGELVTMTEFLEACRSEQSIRMYLYPSSSTSAFNWHHFSPLPRLYYIIHLLFSATVYPKRLCLLGQLQAGYQPLLSHFNAPASENNAAKTITRRPPVRRLQCGELTVCLWLGLLTI